MFYLRSSAGLAYLLLFLTVLALSVFWSSAVSAAPWDDWLKKAEEVVEDTVDDVLDEPDVPHSQEEVVEEIGSAQDAPAVDKPTQPDRKTYAELATNAGLYAGLADACGQSVGAAVRADFEPRAAKFPDFNKTLMMQFDGLYNSNLKKGSQRCGDLADYRSKYEASMRAIGAEPVAVSAAQASSPPTNTQGGLPIYGRGGAPTARQEPNLGELKSLAGYAGAYAGRGVACDVTISAKIRPDFIAQIARQYPEYQAELTAAFDGAYPALADSWCDEMRLGIVKQRYESTMTAHGMTPVLDEAPKEAAAGSPAPVSAPEAPAANTKTSGDFQEPETCGVNVLERTRCKQIVANPGNHWACKVEACEQWLATSPHGD
ncbi:MAG: hypothetical protein QNJ73_09885 [Gammaproteobacteria bacterium]|nr:hypothetical protein [Gammaproteobacteria bacterium]